MNLQIIGKPGPSLPIHIHRDRFLPELVAVIVRTNGHDELLGYAADDVGKADPIWDTAFTTKFSKKPDPDAPLMTPYAADGVTTIIEAYEPPAEDKPMTRQEELNWLRETQHLELASTADVMKANGIKFARLDREKSEDEKDIDYAERDVNTTHYSPDPEYRAAMERRITWERCKDANGPLHRCRFEQMPDGNIGISYIGFEKNVEATLAYRRWAKTKWLERFGTFPDMNLIIKTRARMAKSKTPILDMLDWKQRKAFDKSKKYGTEDPDPGRFPFHGDPDPKPHRGQYAYGDCRNCILDIVDPVHNGCTKDGTALFAIDLELWEHRHIEDVNYAGPRGLLGIDDTPSLKDDSDDEDDGLDD